MYKPAPAIINPNIIPIALEYRVILWRSILDTKKATKSMASENPAAKRAMFIIL